MGGFAFSPAPSIVYNPLDAKLLKGTQTVNKRRRKSAWMEMFPEAGSMFASVASFWTVMLFWNFFGFKELELVPRFGLAAAVSMIVFVVAEVAGMILMSLMKEKWQAEARADARFEAMEEALRETLQETRAARIEAREARKEAREEALAASEREARLQETVLALLKRLDAESAKGERD